MSNVDQALVTQLNNIQTRTGKTLAELFDMIRGCGLAKHGERRDWLIGQLGLGHGDAGALVYFFERVPAGTDLSDAAVVVAAAAPTGDMAAVLDEIYAGAKAPLRPIHDRLMAEINDFGEFEIAPKKGYVSLRRKKQFAMIGPATKTRVEVGLNMKDVPGTERLLAQPPGGMCQYKVNVTDTAEVDPELIGWIRTAYERAG